MPSILERAFDLAFGPQADFCPICRGPNPRASLIVIMRHGQELSSCRQCGRATNAEGRCIEPPEKPGVLNYIKVIRLAGDEDDELEDVPLPT